MNAMPVVPVIDPQPILDLIRQKGGECLFNDAVQALVDLGQSESSARDALWRLLSDGTIEFTVDRHLTVPKPDALDGAAG